MVVGCSDPRPKPTHRPTTRRYDDYYYHRSYNSYNYPPPDNPGKSCEVFIGRENYLGYQMKMAYKCKTCAIEGEISFCDVRSLAWCTAEKSFTVGSEMEPIIWIEAKEEKIKFWLGQKNTRLLAEFEDVYGNSSKAVTFTKEDPLSEPKLFDHKVLQSQTANSTLTSSQFTLQDNFCLSVVLKADHDLQEDLLRVSVTDASTSQEFQLGTYRHQKSGWHTWQLKQSVQNQLKGKTARVELKLLTNTKVYIQRIAGCNVADEEEVFVVNSTLLNGNIERKAYNMSFEPRKIISKSDSCDNGGVMTTAGCACPAGFTGPNCTEACGPNSYGQDCRGQCSVYSEECKGLLLCTLGAGCHCAPGYQGPHCDQACENGKYGVDCGQTCGKCMDDCDRYSGLCTRCVDGYYPPFCSEKYIHFKEAPEVASDKYQTISVKMNFSRENMEGSGKPTYYQVQYKVGNVEWKSFVTKPMPVENETENVEMTCLEDAMEHRVRVLLLAGDYNSYQGEDIPTASVYTKCIIPDSYDYKITLLYSCNLLFQDFQGNCLRIFWNFMREEHWCHVVGYELWRKEGWKWIQTITGEHDKHYKMSEILPGKQLQFKLRALTTAGPAPFSDVIKSVSPYEGIRSVRHLKVKSVNGNSALISWDTPEPFQQHESNYTVIYHCVGRLTCSVHCDRTPSTVTTSNLSAVISPLLPAAQYEVSVSADSGPKVFTRLGTLESVPQDSEEVPSTSLEEAIRTNSSLTFFWEQPRQMCSGFFVSYHYELYQASNLSSVMERGDNRETNISFSRLRASTSYVLRVFVNTVRGWNPSRYLTLNATTTATAPEEVIDLTVYKRSRSMVGLRWAQPRALYGDLESFTVAYAEGSQVKSVKIMPVKCTPWPDLYCYMVDGLKPSRTYNFSVSARNQEIYEDGPAAFVLGQTRESAPTAPRSLRVRNVTGTSLGLQWEHPDLANGVLRSFIVNVEEVERFDQDQCCQVYPIIEIPATEHEYYELEVTDLHPASTYTVSVTAKTVVFGPPMNVTVTTRPPPLSVSAPLVDLHPSAVSGCEWLPQSRTNTSHLYTALVRSHILLVLKNNLEEESGIKESRLKNLLQNLISTPFYFAAEYHEGETVTLGSGGEGESEWGHFSNPPLPRDQVYQLAAVQISEYNSVLNTDILLSHHITSVPEEEFSYEYTD